MAGGQPWKIPPNVQEPAAAGVQVPPSRYVLREEDSPAEPIPIIDLSRLSASDGAEEMAKLRSSLQNWGLLVT